jgi:hypothetical protein
MLRGGRCTIWLDHTDFGFQEFKSAIYEMFTFAELELELKRRLWDQTWQEFSAANFGADFLRRCNMDCFGPHYKQAIPIYLRSLGNDSNGSRTFYRFSGVDVQG